MTPYCLVGGYRCFGSNFYIHFPFTLKMEAGSPSKTIAPRTRLHGVISQEILTWYRSAVSHDGCISREHLVSHTTVEVVACLVSSEPHEAQREAHCVCLAVVEGRAPRGATPGAPDHRPVRLLDLQ
jgi:hypothetical protein